MKKYGFCIHISRERVRQRERKKDKIKLCCCSFIHHYQFFLCFFFIYVICGNYTIFQKYDLEQHSLVEMKSVNNAADVVCISCSQIEIIMCVYNVDTSTNSTRK